MFVSCILICLYICSSLSYISSYFFVSYLFIFCFSNWTFWTRRTDLTKLGGYVGIHGGFFISLTSETIMTLFKVLSTQLGIFVSACMYVCVCYYVTTLCASSCLFAVCLYVFTYDPLYLMYLLISLYLSFLFSFFPPGHFGHEGLI